MATTKDSSSLAQEILRLRKSVESASKLRAQAEAGVASNKALLADVERRITDLGFDAPTLGDQLQALETSLMASAAEIEKRLDVEVAEYRRILGEL